MKKTTKLLIATSILALIPNCASADVMEITLPNPCELLADAECEVDGNGEIVIIGDGSEIVSKFESKRAILVDSLDAYKICALESDTNKDLKICKKSYKKSLKK